MINTILIPMIACVSCMQVEKSSDVPTPRYPLYFVEEDPHVALFDRIGKITPAPVKRALLIPFFMAENRQRFVACPFVYQPGEPVVLPKDRTPKYAQYKGIIALCGGYLPTKINGLFPDTDTINGKKSQLIELGKARYNEESLRILDDWAIVLGSKSFSVTGKFEVLKETNPEKGRYGTSNELLYPPAGEYARFPLWPYDVGTVIKVELTQDDKKIVAEFIKEEKERFSPKDQTKDK